MQLSIVIILLGSVAFANSLSVETTRTSEESKVDSKLSSPAGAKNSEMNSYQISLREQLNSTPINPGHDGTKGIVPLPTLAPTSPSTTAKTNPKRDDTSVPSPPVECESLPEDIGTRLSAQLLKVLTVLG
ncbi:uncharacterized protein LOC108095762 [Drosophila ficusphila]|uniref:uncharacterized protein LOC108095762 n=1 Tax=Drosophila ficusphila TaxID=30025 RepID=UPI0007E65431|nr:uncharacterized protein LOC108095762 [Drosophila ficusphila]